MEFTKAIVRTPGKSVINGITSIDMGNPDYEKAIQQHKAYIAALESCNVEVTVLSPKEKFPDSCFVEDTALITPRCTIITNPGAHSRKGEEKEIRELLENDKRPIEDIVPPATIEGGDIMMVGSTYYVGISQRTNPQGADRLIAILNKYNYKGVKVSLAAMLHLKTGLSYLENNNLLISGEFVDNHLFNSFNKIVVEEEEAYAANAIWVNGKVLIPAGFPITKNKIESLGYPTIPVEMSEFQKIDGGLSCLSLRY